MQGAPGDGQVNHQRSVPTASSVPSCSASTRQPTFQTGKNFDQPASSIPINELYHILERVRRPVGQQSPHQRRLPGRGCSSRARDRGYGHRRLTVMRRQGHRLAIQSLAYPARWTVRAAGRMNSTSPVVRPGQPVPQFLPVVVLRLCWDRSASPPACCVGRRIDQRPQVAFSIRHRPAGYRARFPPDRRRSRSPRPSAGFPLTSGWSLGLRAHSQASSTPAPPRPASPPGSDARTARAGLRSSAVPARRSPVAW